MIESEELEKYIKPMYEQYGLTKEQYEDIIEPYKLLILNLLKEDKAKIKIELANNLIKGELIKMAELFNIQIITIGETNENA